MVKCRCDRYWQSWTSIGLTSLSSHASNTSPTPRLQVLQESIEIPGTGLRLVYNSQDASGYHSTLLMRLTPELVPETLALVHLKVVVEGTVFTKTFESDPNITYSYSWNKRNVYEQKVREQRGNLRIIFPGDKLAPFPASRFTFTS